MIFCGLGLSPPSPLPPGAWRRPWGVLGYPKRKMEIIFEILTIKNPRIDITHVFLYFMTQPPLAPTPKKVISKKLHKGRNSYNLNETCSGLHTPCRNTPYLQFLRSLS